MRGRGACMVAGVRGREGVHGRGACVLGVCVRHARPPPRQILRDTSMSGRYASYWNAFLLNLHLFHERACVNQIKI